MDLPNIVNYERRCHRPTQTWNIHQRTFLKCNFYYSEQSAFVCLWQLQYIATVCFQNNIFKSIGNQRNTPDSNRVKSPLYTTKIYKLEPRVCPMYWSHNLNSNLGLCRQSVLLPIFKTNGAQILWIPQQHSQYLPPGNQIPNQWTEMYRYQQKYKYIWKRTETENTEQLHNVLWYIAVHMSKRYMKYTKCK